RSGGRRAWLGAALATGLALLAHNIGAIWAPPYLAGALAAGWLYSADLPPRTRLRQAGLAAGALLLGLGLAAFLILPALAELPYIQSSRLTVPGFLNYHNNFLSLAELLALPRPFDPSQVGQVYPRSLGLAQIALAVVGALFFWREPRRLRWVWLGLLAASLLAVALTQSVSLPVWDALGPMKFIQFPWRWLGPASLTLALLAGYGAARAAERLGRWAPLGLAALLAVLVAANLSWAFTTYNPPLEKASLAANVEVVRQFERASGLIGLSTQGEFLPTWVTQVPAPDTLAARLTPDDLIDRLGPNSLPPGASLLSIDNRLTATHARILAPAGGEVIFDWFYFPGWRATVNGRPAETRPADAAGRLGVSVPAGESTVTVTFGDKPVRTAGWAISLLALAGVVVIAIRLRPSVAANALPPAGLPARQWILTAAIVGLGLGAARIGLVDRGLTPWLQTRLRDGTVRGAGAALDIAFADQLKLLAWDAPAPAPSGGTARFRLYWQSLQPLARDYSIATHLLDENGLLVAQSDSMHPGGTPTTVWATDRYDIDDHAVALPAGLPPGEYRLLVGVYVGDSGEQLTPQGEGARAGQMVEIGTLQVTRPKENPSAAELPIGQRLNASFGAIHLIGMDFNQAPLRPGDDLLATGYWQAAAAPATDAAARFELTDAAGVRFITVGPPASHSYPTSQWTAGEILRGIQVLRIPAAAAPGPLKLTITLVDGTDAPLGEPVAGGTVEVLPVARS
ncbi:MAG: hypothetical protein ABI847_14295, partial [Anaerolineales bacterium]